MAVADVAGTQPVLAGDELTDEQIQELLSQATARLQQKAQLASKSPNQTFNFPKLNAGKLEKPYVSQTGDVAHVDAPRLLEARQRKQAGLARKVEDPVASKKKNAEVSTISLTLSCL